MHATTFDLVATVIFGMSILHTFSVKFFLKLAVKYPEGSVLENLFHFLGEIEVVFGLWAALLVVYVFFVAGGRGAVEFVEAQNFTEPIFVFAVMVISASRPCLYVVEQLLNGVSRVLPMNQNAAFVLVALGLGPLLGSLFTEPAAMTVLALLLRDRFFNRTSCQKLKYAALAVLLVNVSIGGVLTPYAAPPVIMVASRWGWDLSFMVSTFGLKAVLAVFINVGLLVMCFRKKLSDMSLYQPALEKTRPLPWWLVVVHLGFMLLTVVTAHHPAMFMGLFLFFLGVTTITAEYQSELKIREALLVAFFLAGLVVLGGPQRWWLEPLLPQLTSSYLFLASIGLTAIFDNAALTYLGSQVPNLGEALKYVLVAGAVTGGGLTVIANAPNPVAFQVLQGAVSKNGINPFILFGYALVPTIIAGLSFWSLP